MDCESADDPGNDKTEDDVGDGIGITSLVVGTIGLFVGLLTVLGARGVALSLGIVSFILAGVALRRADTGAERGTAYGGLALGLVTLTIGAFVARSG